MALDNDLGLWQEGIGYEIKTYQLYFIKCKVLYVPEDSQYQQKKNTTQ